MTRTPDTDASHDLAGLGPDIFRRLADASADGISMARLDSRIIYANASIGRLLGLSSADELLDRSFYDFLLPDEAARLRDVIIPQVQATGEWTGEMRLMSPSGAMRQTVLNIFLIRNQAGTPVAFATVITNITEYKAMDAVLAHSYQLLEAVFDSTDLLVAYLDPEMNFLMVNRAYARADGKETADFPGKNHFDLYPHPENEAIFRRAVETGEPCRVLARPFEYSGKPERGVTYWDWSLIPTRDASGRVSGVLLTLLDVSERIRAIESAYLSQAAIESSINAIAMSSLDGKLTYVNRAFVDLWRLDTPAAALGRSLLEFWEDPRQAQAVVDALQQQEHWQGEMQARRQDGSLVELQLSAYLARDTEGRPVCMISSFMDISAHKQAERELLRSEALLASIVQHLPAVVFLKRASDLRFELFNQTGEELLGLEKDAILDKTDFDLFPPEQAAFFAAKDREVLASGLPLDIPEEPVQGADGQIHLMHTRKIGIYDTAGKPIYLLGIALDITERIQAIKALQRSELELKQLNESLETLVRDRTSEIRQQSRRYDAILNTAIDGFFAADSMGRIRDANPAYCAMLGYTEDEMLGLSVPDIEAIESPADVARRIEYLMVHRRAHFDSRHRRKDGSEVEVEVSISTSNIGDEIMFYAFVHDITPRKAAAAAMSRARDEAERANAAKSEFLSRMSHELRTPLNAILGFGQLLEIDPEYPLAPGQAHNVREILQGGQHLLALVNEVLDLSRIESGHMEIKLEPIAIGPLIEACVAHIQPLAAQRDLSIALTLEAPCAIQADYTRIKQVLLNLLSNAVKYNREGGRIEVGCHTVEGDRVRISVRDTGIGIAPEAMPRMFQLFERLETSYSGIEGAGIGLALSKRLVEAMSGTIGVQSTHGVGSTFWIDLLTAAIQPALANAPDAAQPHTNTMIKPRTLLYVEDNPANLRLMHSILTYRKSLTLIDAHTGELGIELAKSNPPDLILLDIGLPGMNGFEVLRHLRTDPSTVHIPVIAVSANAMPRDIERGRAEGFADYLTKPIDISKFLGILDLYLPDGPDRKS
jgi:PAS domain S-box-containing protein